MRTLKLTLLLGLFSGGRALAQNPDWVFYLPTNTGIPGDYVYAAAFAPDGRVWVAAEDPVWDEGGLGVFDGEAWDVINEEDGLPTYYVGDVVIDADGTVWAGTPAGLARRAAGGTTWEVFTPSNSPLPALAVSDVALDGEGGVWVATTSQNINQGGLAHFDGTTWEVYTTLNSGIPGNLISAVAVEPSGAVWAGVKYEGVVRFDGTTWTLHDEMADLDGPPSIVVGDDGRVWVGTNGRGFWIWNGTAWTNYNRNNAGLPTDFFYAIALEPGGGVAWLGTLSNGLARFDGSTFQWHYPPQSHIYTVTYRPDGSVWTGGIGGLTHMTPNGGGGYAMRTYRVHNTGLPERWINAIAAEPAPPGQPGPMWFASGGGGATRFDGRVWRNFNPYNMGFEPWPFPTDAVDDLALDANGHTWIAADGFGVARWDGAAWAETYGAAELGTPWAEQVAVATDGSVWAGLDFGANGGGVARIANGTVTRFTSENSPLPAGDIADVTAAPDGAVWIAAGSGAARYGPDGTWTVYRQADGLPHINTWAVGVGPDGTAWVATGDGVARIEGGAVTAVYRESEGLPADVCQAITFTPDGTAWAGCFDGQNWPYHGGVARFNGTTWTAFTAENSPLPHEQIWSLTSDHAGNLWIGTASEGVAVYRAGGVVTDDETGPLQPASRPLELSSPRPHPAHGLTRLTLTLAEAQAVEVAVFDALGRRVAALHEGPLGAGDHALTVEVAGFPPGLYVVRAAAAGGSSAARRLVVAR
ncbi:MAG TPA: two-component regulator propeller domain-containing protein [Rubricoccaceae bacterium]|nr:two-component regulator propeller domain-containing protein [Rubricoccaceae bacterium]